MFKEMFISNFINENQFIEDAKKDLEKLKDRVESSDEKSPKINKDIVKRIDKMIKDMNRGALKKEAQLEVFKEFTTYMKKLKFEDNQIGWVPSMVEREFNLWVNP